jgi:hypothetical protein
MSTVFQINFRREAHRREVARTRARVVGLGVWLAYFGAIGVIFGLYALNFAAVKYRTRIVERQLEAQRARGKGDVDWAHQSAEMALVSRAVNDPRQWRARLERLPLVLPANTRLTTVDFNPSGVSGSGDWDRLVLAGVLRVDSGQDRMKGVADLVMRLQTDSLLARHYRSIKLATTRISDPTGSSAEFVIECRP